MTRRRWVPVSPLWRRVVRCPGGAMAVYRFRRWKGDPRHVAATTALGVARVYLSGRGLGRWS